MCSIYSDMSESPYLTAFILYVFAEVLLKIISRILRYWNLRKHGYPPAHCDADGDFKPAEKTTREK